MANTFLIEIHDFISHRMEADRRHLAAARAAGDVGQTAFFKGRLSQWDEIRTFLSDHFDLLTMKYY